jgi:hypothetical protein
VSDSLRDLLRQGADTVGRPQVPIDELVAITERRLVRRRLAVVAASAAAAALVTIGGLALRPDDERLAPAPPAPTETEHPPGPLRDVVFSDADRYMAVPPGLYAVPFSGWGDVPPEVANLRAVVEFPAGLMNLHRSTFAEDRRAADPRELGFWTVETVPSDFCRSASSEAFTNPGPTVTDLAAALATQPRLRGTDARPVTIGGYDGLYVELTKPPSDCGTNVLWFAPRVEHIAYEERFMRPGDVARIWIIDVGGKRVVIDTIHPADASAEKVAQTTRMVETATFMTVK